MSGPLCESCGYWSATNGPLCESCANDAYAARIAALKVENARLRRELAGYVEALGGPRRCTSSVSSSLTLGSTASTQPATPSPTQKSWSAALSDAANSALVDIPDPTEADRG